MNKADDTIDVRDFDRHTVVAVVRYLYTGDIDIQQLLMPEVCRFATRWNLVFVIALKACRSMLPCYHVKIAKDGILVYLWKNNVLFMVACEELQVCLQHFSSSETYIRNVQDAKNQYKNCSVNCEWHSLHESAYSRSEKEAIKMVLW